MGCLNIYRILRFTYPLHNEKIIMLERNGVDITNQVLYSWSTDGVCWTEFTFWDNYRRIIPNIETDYFLRIRFTGDIPTIFLDGVINNCYTVILDTTNRFEITSCEDNEFNFFDNISCALQLQQQMADKISCLFGIQIYYFRVLPEQDTKDIVFKEYTLHDVSAVKNIKMVIPDGQMPSSKPVFTDFDFDWETDWEVEISKTHFARAFGSNAFPKQRDFIYIPMMKRMYEVNSAYDEKEGQLMWQSTMWKLGLIKWNEKTNIDYTGFEDVIDKFVVNKYDILPEIDEEERISGYNDGRLPLYIPNNLHNVFMEDCVRHSMTEYSIKEFRLHHKNVSITQHIYDFKSTGVVNYQKQICGDNGTISFIISIPQLFNETEGCLVECGEVKLWFKKTMDGVLIYDVMKNELLLNELNNYIINYTWNRNTFTVELSAYIHTLGKKYVNLPLYKQKPDMFTMEHVQTVVGVYCNDYSQNTPKNISIYPFPILITNFKVYKTHVPIEEMKYEMLKYSTKHEDILINDNCIPLDNGFGSNAK